MREKNWAEAVSSWTEAVAGCAGQIPPPLQGITSALAFHRHAGLKVRCNLCGCPLFADRFGRKNIQCLSCLSLERTRLMGLYLQKLDILRKDSRVLHIAPEQGIYEWAASVVPPENYHLVDLDPEQYRFTPHVRAFNLCRDSENLPENYYDLILHSHVLEHVTCDYRQVLRHLHRAMKPEGWHVCIIPFMNGRYDECLTGLSREDAAARFGDAEHVRRFGVKDIDDTLGRVLSFDRNFDASADFPEAVLRAANVPETFWKGLTPNTVLRLRKSDFIDQDFAASKNGR